MSIDDQDSLYEVLETPPTSTQAELRQAYLAAKATFSKDNSALYSMLSNQERLEMLQKIERAYEVLGDPEQRRSYDQSHGHVSLDGWAPNQTAAPSQSLNLNRVTSIDRVPPMDTTFDLDPSLSVAPTESALGSVPVEPTYERRPPSSGELFIPDPPSPAPPAPPIAASQPVRITLDPVLRSRLETEESWPGTLYRALRESLHISIEELAEMTKLSKTYLGAIEREDFDKLPAPVFVRGFLTQYLKCCKVPAHRISTGVAAYMSRFEPVFAKRR